MVKKNSKPWLNFMEVKQQCPMVVKHIPPSLSCKDYLIGGEWQVFKSIETRNSNAYGNKKIYITNNTELSPMREIKAHMESTGGYTTGIFPENLNIILVLPVERLQLKNLSAP